MANREVTTSGSHLANALVTPTGAATDVTLANVAQVALSSMRTTDTIAALTAISSPAANQLVYVRGYHTPGDGGGGMFSWIADSNAIADTGTVIEQESSGTGRWLRLFEPGIINAKWFATEDDLISYCTSHRPLTVMFPPGVYNFANKIMPTGIHLVGPGWQWSGGQPYGGFGTNSAVLIGPIMQGLGPSGASFRNLVFSGGFTITKQYNLFENCAFTGEGGTLSLDFSIPDTAPYYNTIKNCIFRGIIGGPCLHLKGQANGNRILNCVFLIGQSERGIVAEFHTTEGPLFNSIIGCGFERPSGVTSIASFIYGSFRKCIFLSNYFDSTAPTFTDGAAWVFDNYSRENRIWHGQLYNSAEGVINSGLGNIFHCVREKQIYSNGTDGNLDLGQFAGVSDLYVMGAGVVTATLPPISRAYSHPLKIVVRRSEGTTISPAAGETINGASSFAMTAGITYTFYTLYGGVAVTDWKVAQGA